MLAASASIMALHSCTGAYTIHTLPRLAAAAALHVARQLLHSIQQRRCLRLVPCQMFALLHVRAQHDEVSGK